MNGVNEHHIDITYIKLGVWKAS